MMFLTLLVKSQNTLGTTTNVKCFSSSAQRSEFLPSFSKSSSWANVPFKSYKHCEKHKENFFYIVSYNNNQQLKQLVLCLEFKYAVFVLCTEELLNFMLGQHPFRPALIKLFYVRSSTFSLQFIFSFHNHFCMYHLYLKEDKLLMKHVLSNHPDCQCDL